MRDTGVQSAWQENTALGERETACESQNCSSYPLCFLPFQVHAGVTDVVAKRAVVASSKSGRGWPGDGPPRKDRSWNRISRVKRG